MKKRLLSLILTVLLVSLTCMPAIGSTVVDKDGKQVSTVVASGEGDTYNFAFSQEDSLGVNGSFQEYGVVIPIQVTGTGKLYLNISLDDTDMDKELYGELYTDAACTTMLRNRLWLSVNNDDPAESFEGIADIKPGTYYFRICSKNNGIDPIEPFQNTGVVSILFASIEDRALASDSITTIGTSDKGTYLKLVAPKNGYLCIVGSEFTNLKLYNNKKVAVTNGYVTLQAANVFINMFPVTAGTYYLWTKGSTQIYAIGYKFMEESTLKSGQSFGVAAGNSDQNFYVKIKPSKSGYITFTTGTDLSGYITLCDGKKKALSKECKIKGCDYKDNKVVYPVKKNTSYYIRMRSSVGIFNVKYSFKAITEKSGSSVKKAVSFTKGKTVSGLIIPGESKKDYYKIKLTKEQIVSLKVKGNVSSGKIQIKFYKDSKLKKSIGSATLYKYGQSITLKSINYSNKHKLSKGTYYVVIERKDKYSSGNYSIQWMK